MAATAVAAVTAAVTVTAAVPAVPATTSVVAAATTSPPAVLVDIDHDSSGAERVARLAFAASVVVVGAFARDSAL